MKYVVVLAVVAVLMALLTVDAKPIYRGVATDVWAGGCSDLQALDHMSWYWNYKVKPNAGDDSCDLGGRYLEFVPMIWGKSQAEQTNLATEIPAGTTHLMAFNEPQISGQSDLTPSEAATLWKQVIAQLDAAGRTSSIKFGAPSASPGGSDPIVWLQDFFTACDGCRFDFITLHNYDCNSPYYNGDSTMYWVNLYNSTFGKPIWLTEFACPGNQISEANELKYMNDLLAKLDNAPYVERYSWFTARATNVGTIPSLFTSTAGQLTNVGVLYNGKGDIINPSGSTTGSSDGNDGSNSSNNNNGNNSGASSLSSIFLDTLKSL